MASILKVSQLQKPDGSTPTAADLGIDVAGSVVQVVTASDGTTNITGSSTFIEGGFTLNITPKYANSIILLSYTLPNVYTDGAGDIMFFPTRDGLNIHPAGLNNSIRYGYSYYTTTHFNPGERFTINFEMTDSPNTTSAITYGWKVATTSSNTMYSNYPVGEGYQTITAYEIAQ